MCVFKRIKPQGGAILNIDRDRHRHAYRGGLCVTRLHATGCATLIIRLQVDLSRF